MKKHTIWDSDGWMDLEKDDGFLEFLREDYPDVLEDEQKIMEFAIDENWHYLDDERSNLDFPCTLVAVGSVGLWHGYYEGYMVEDNLNKCFDMSGVDADCSAHLYVEGQTLKGRFAHHDCPMGYIFTFYIVDESLKGAENFIERLHNRDIDKLTPSMIKRYCRSAGRKVKEIYGF